ncbi:MAG: hypothetical protein M1820_002894 [Bogoriella megaspora]|nr:MAG: hypothetical protein M1820_002894 [Bogoriella megaspora]
MTLSSVGCDAEDETTRSCETLSESEKEHTISECALFSHQNELRDQVEAGTQPVSVTAQCARNHDLLVQNRDLEKQVESGAQQSLFETEHSHENDASADYRDVRTQNATPSTEPLYSVFSKNEKRFIIFMAACAGFFSPMSANIYFPALNTLAKEYRTSSSVMNLTLTSYMIFQGLAPTIFGDLADMGGRRVAYILGFIIYIAACVGIALNHSFGALLALRCLQSSGSSSTIALGSGVAADISTSSERGICHSTIAATLILTRRFLGVYMGAVTSLTLIAPAISPIVGGLLAQYLGWRAIFWFLTICAGAFVIPLIIAFPETGRNVVGNGSVPPQGWNMNLLNYLKTRRNAKDGRLTQTLSRESGRQVQCALAEKRKVRWPNPLNTLQLVLEKDVGMLLLYNSLVYTAFYDVITSIPYLFQQIYGFNDLQIGLCFIPFGVGCFIAPILNGRLLDWNFRRIAKTKGTQVDRKRGNDLKDFPIETARIQISYPLLYVGIATLLCYGWVMEVEAPLAAPLTLQVILGITLTGAFQCMSVLLVDLYPLSPSTATASNNLVRCLVGAAGTAVIIQMLESMGRGWCFTFVSGVIFATSPMLWALTRWGPQWRQARVERRSRP